MRVTISLPEDVVKHLSVISQRSGIPKSRLISRLIEDCWNCRNWTFAAPDAKVSDAKLKNDYGGLGDF